MYPRSCRYQCPLSADEAHLALRLVNALPGTGTESYVVERIKHCVASGANVSRPLYVVHRLC